MKEFELPAHTDHTTPSKQYIGCAECQKRGGELAKAYLARNPQQDLRKK